MSDTGLTEAPGTGGAGTGGMQRGDLSHLAKMVFVYKNDILLSGNFERNGVIRG